MGGDGSMTKWVEEEPALANKDYTHFNFRGAKKVAGILYDQISKGYEEYKILRKQRKAAIEPEKTPIDSITPKLSESDEE
jgi:hypothetical protein